MIDFSKYLSAQGLEVFSVSGFGKIIELGTNPALLVIDVTYEFTGAIREPILDAVKKIRTACGEQAWDAVANIKQLIETCRQNGVPVIYTKPNRNSQLNTVFDKKNTRRDEVYAQNLGSIVEEISPLAPEQVFEKLHPSGFIGTDLLPYLISKRIDTLLVTGGTTSGCVRATVVDAFSYGYKVAVVEEGVFDRGEMSHVINLFDMKSKYSNLISLVEAIRFIEKVN